MSKQINYHKKRPIKTLVFSAIILLATITAVRATTSLIKADEPSQPILAEEDLPPSTILPIIEPTKEQVKEEIIRQAELFGLGSNIMLDLANCESGLRWNAKNANSTATGVYQYLEGTWNRTKSAEKGISRLDYKANIREAMIDIANGEESKWQECLDKANLKFN